MGRALHEKLAQRRSERCFRSPPKKGATSCPKNSKEKSPSSPMPLDAPVTTATFPSSFLDMTWLLFSVVIGNIAHSFAGLASRVERGPCQSRGPSDHIPKTRKDKDLGGCRT